MCIYLLLQPPTNMPNSSSSSVGISTINQEKQLQEAKVAVKTDALLMKKALVILFLYALIHTLFKHRVITIFINLFLIIKG